MTYTWKLKVTSSERLSIYLFVQDVRVPVQLQRAMAAEAEAAREARAKVVAAEGEQKASLHLKEAALVLEESTSALQLRYLQVRWPPRPREKLTWSWRSHPPPSSSDISR